MPTPKPNTRSATTTTAQTDELKKLILESRDSVIEVFRSEIRDLERILSSRIDVLEASMESIRNDHNELANDFAVLRQTVNANTQQIFDFCMDEVQQRITRMNSLVCHGIPEKSDGTIQERREWDKQKIEEILDEIDVDLSDGEILESRRIGKSRSDGTRLLKIRVLNQAKKSDILRKSRSLKNSTHRNVYIHQDLTPFQQSQERNLRSELKRRRQNGEDIVIHRNKIVSRSQFQNFQ